MEYRSMDEIRDTGTVLPDVGQLMSRRERLERWAELLERKAGCVSALEGTEFQRRAVRGAMHAAGAASSATPIDMGAQWSLALSLVKT